MGFFGDIAGGVLGKVIDYDVSRKLQHDKQDWSTGMYAKRYQMTMRDMKLAGLNPIMAAGTGAGNIPSAGGPASTGPMQNPFIASAQIAKSKAEAELQRKLTEESIERKGLTIIRENSYTRTRINA